MITQGIHKRALLATLMFVCLGSASATEYPIEISVAFTEETQLVCAKAQPTARGAFQARKALLYSEAPDKVKAAKASKDYSEAQKWARDTLRPIAGAALAELCREFLARSDLALNQNPYEPLHRPL